MREDGSGIKIRSFVYDVGPNLEVGSLLIEKCSQSDPKEKLIELPDNFKQATGIKILHIVEGDSNVESGIVSTSSMNEELFILPGEMPHSLHIQAPFFSDSFKSEYNLEYYKRDCS